MKPNKPVPRATQVSKVIPLSPHLRRIVVSGDSLSTFPEGMEGGYVKVVLPEEGGERKMRSYTIRAFDPKARELSLDFVINRHRGPATDWAATAVVGDRVGIAGPGPMKLTNYRHHSYLLVGDLTSINAINGYLPRFRADADVRALISVPTREDIIELDYDSSHNTRWIIEDESFEPLQQRVLDTARGMAADTHVFLALEASQIRALRAPLQEQIGIDRLNLFAVGYWKQGVDADRFGLQKRAAPL
ncbi:NADPH-dependent ferric siderophore reductase, contains FAD-binding and SIP domains [Ferrimonas sediminum]|uniref:NADPH-dependent ferric siderophore reductase, contains FAD-binding and SIP domains n=1 Tax=Ferrimonas sediminum TaxID=718193 RepID=A0A1G9AYY2_9GAMM|nr:siderophore-interacting protein [Ferrimonas sediminum]SDK32443.1 NADPH-dependent ferric siderophore reductase, contains FAD-binding and SIP domains [Ferrimonas sediminum]